MKYTCDKCGLDIYADDYALLKSYKNLRFKGMYSLCKKCAEHITNWILNDGN